MTRDEAEKKAWQIADERAEEAPEYVINPHVFKAAIVTGFMDCYDWMMGSQWRVAEMQAPQNNTNVLTWSEGYGYDAVTFSDNRYRNGYESVIPTHWMPLPPPPKEEVVLNNGGKPTLTGDDQ